MPSILRAISATIYLAVGVVSAIMAGKSLLSKKCLPFHEQAAGKPWEELEPRVKSVILALMRVSGLGFMVVALLLLVLPIFIYCANSLYMTLVISLVSLLFCVGLFLINLQLSAKTGARTPWKGALYAAILIAISFGMFITKW